VRRPFRHERTASNDRRKIKYMNAFRRQTSGNWPGDLARTARKYSDAVGVFQRNEIRIAEAKERLSGD
jgi:hypothetical protein